MGCTSSYQDPTTWEKEASKVLSFLDELSGKKLNSSHLSGFHPKAYDAGISQKKLDNLTSTLCSKLKVEKNVTIHSLELQLWWRDHAKFDKDREKEEKEEKSRIKTLAGIYSDLNTSGRKAMKSTMKSKDFTAIQKVVRTLNSKLEDNKIAK
jgi:hypothetical protein